MTDVAIVGIGMHEFGRTDGVSGMDQGVVALFELTLQGDEVKVVDEKHYKLVPATDLDRDAIRAYR